MGANNTIASQLQLNVVLDAAMRAFKRRVLPVFAFAHTIQAVQLKGTNKIEVPYYPLATGASTDFSYTDGYTSNTRTLSYKEVEVKKRKYQSITIQSDEFRRQPMVDWTKFATLMGERLAEDVVTDIFSVVTAANYVNLGWGGPAGAFDYGTMCDLRTRANQDMWPKSRRSVILDSAYDGNLFKSTMPYNVSGLPGSMTTGESRPVAGFDTYECPIIPGNGTENIVGAAVYESAVLVAFVPIEPLPQLQATVVKYQAYSDPDTGLTLEFRETVDGLHDTVYQTIECNYGYGVGEKAALRRITSVAP